jgi:hypothetical protein
MTKYLRMIESVGGYVGLRLAGFEAEMLRLHRSVCFHLIII